eukprot:1158578-Pelagomonas_calceolata.AAC.10
MTHWLCPNTSTGRRDMDVVLRLLTLHPHHPHASCPCRTHWLCPNTGRRYVDVVLRLLEKAGDFVSDDIWHRVVQLVTNNHTMQQYAARNIVESLRRGAQDEVRCCVCVCM